MADSSGPLSELVWLETRWRMDVRHPRRRAPRRSRAGGGRMGSRGLTGGHLEKAVLPPTNLQFFLNLWRREVCDKPPLRSTSSARSESPVIFLAKHRKISFAFFLSFRCCKSSLRCVFKPVGNTNKKKTKNCCYFCFNFLSFGIERVGLNRLIKTADTILATWVSFLYFCSVTIQSVALLVSTLKICKLFSKKNFNFCCRK